MNIESLKVQVDRLSRTEKRELYNYLRDTIFENDDFELSAKWKSKLDRRRQNLVADASGTLPLREFMQQFLNR